MKNNRIDLDKLKTDKEIKQAINDWKKLPFVDFCIKYKNNKGNLLKAHNHLKKLEKEVKNENT